MICWCCYLFWCWHCSTFGQERFFKPAAVSFWHVAHLFFFFFNFVQFIQLFLKVGCNWHKTLLVSAMQPNGSTFVYIIILPSYHSDSVLGSYCSSCRYSYFSKASWFLLMESGNKWHFCPFTCSGPKEISWFSLSLSILYSVFNPSATSNGSTFKIYPEYDYYYWLFLPLLS